MPRGAVSFMIEFAASLPIFRPAGPRLSPGGFYRSDRLTDSMATEPPRTASMRVAKYFL